MVSAAVLLIMLACILPLPPLSEDALDAIIGWEDYPTDGWSWPKEA